MGRTCSTHVAMGNACKILVGKPEIKRPLWRQSRWEDNIKTDLRTNRVRTGFTWRGRMVDCFKHGNEISEVG